MKSLLILDRIRRNSFFKNIIIIVSGSVIGQAILFLSMPVLARLYTPSDFGYLAIFTSIGSIAAILTTGRYENSVVMPEKDQDGLNLSGLVITLGGIISGVYFLLICAIKLLHLHPLPIFQEGIIYLIPVYTFFAAVYSALLAYINRVKNYKRASYSVVTQALFSTIANIVFASIGAKMFGLIYGLIIGQLGAIIVLLQFMHRNKLLGKIQFSNGKELALKYIAFPKYMTFTDFSTTVSQQITPLIFTSLFSTAIAGFYSMANRVIKIPSILLTTAIANIFKNDAIEEIRSSGNCRQIFRATFIKLSLIGLPILCFLLFFSPNVFTFFLGEQWLEAGYMARILAITFFFDLIVAPFTSLFYIAHQQKLFMIIQVVRTLFNITAVYVGFWLNKESISSLSFFALSDILFSIITLRFIFKIVKLESIRL